VFGCVSDGAANILASMIDLKNAEVIEESHKCSSHTIHLAVTKSLSSCELVNKVRKIVKEIKNSSNSTLKFEKEQMRILQKKQNDYEKWKKISIMHSLEAGTHDQTALLDELPEPNPNSYDGQPLKLMIDVTTRWWSTFTMLARFRQVKDAVEETVSVGLTLAEWNEIEQIIFILFPFAEAVQRLEAQKKPTLSTVWPIVSRLMKFLAGKTEQTPTLPDWTKFAQTANILRTNLITEMEQEDRFKAPTRVMKIASFLDPRFQHETAEAFPEVRNMVENLFDKPTGEVKAVPPQDSVLQSSLFSLFSSQVCCCFAFSFSVR